MSTEQLRGRIEMIPRVHLAHLPTPLEPMNRFSEALGGPRIFIKRDDCTGLALGGNKTRHNEFVLADAVAKGADMLVWGAGAQSNNCRQTAAVCAKLGLDCRLVLTRASGHDDMQGNLLLDHLLGASVRIVDAPIGPQLDELIAEEASRLRGLGRKVYAWDPKVVKPLAAVSYALCMAELADQLADQGIEPAAVYLCSSGSTGAGLALGRAALVLPYPVRNIQPIDWPWDEQEDLARIANEAARLLDLAVRVQPQDIDITGDYIGPGYAVPTPMGMQAITLLARTEAILLDPTYTAKAMAALIDHVGQGAYSSDQAIVFVHTGGSPALFAYRDELQKMIPGMGELNSPP